MASSSASGSSPGVDESVAPGAAAVDFVAPRQQLPENTADAYALLALREASLAPPPPPPPPAPPEVDNKDDVIKWSAVGQDDDDEGADSGPAIAKLNGREFEYLVRKHRFFIGRNSSTRGKFVQLDHCHMGVYIAFGICVWIISKLAI